MPSGSLHIEADNIAQARLLTQLGKLGDHEVLVQPNMRLNTSKGVVVCKDFMVCSEEEIKNGLADQGVLEVRRINKRQGGTLIATPALILTFDRPKVPEKIEACFYKLKVRPYIPFPMRCFKCLKFGHTSLRCRSEGQVCICGLLAHEGLPCQDPPICVNCNEAHNARSPTCAIFQEEKEVQRVKTLQNLPYIEARKIVRSRSYVKPQVSYAAVAKSSTKTVEATNWQKLLQPHTYQASQGPSQPVWVGQKEQAKQPSSLKKEATISTPTPQLPPREAGSNIPSSSGAQEATSLAPSPLPSRSEVGFKPPLGVMPLRFPPRSPPAKRELRGRERRQKVSPSPQPTRAPLIEGSSREEGGSDTESSASNKTILHENQMSYDRFVPRKKKAGRPRRNKALGATSA